MDAEIKRKWVEALRSGKYQQGQSALRNRRDQFCCLGVLCDLVEPERWVEPETYRFSYSHMASGVTGFPTTEIRDRCTLTDEQVQFVANLNDDDKPFSEIADYIEANL